MISKLIKNEPYNENLFKCPSDQVPFAVFLLSFPQTTPAHTHTHYFVLLTSFGQSAGVCIHMPVRKVVDFLICGHFVEICSNFRILPKRLAPTSGTRVQCCLGAFPVLLYVLFFVFHHFRSSVRFLSGTVVCRGNKKSSVHSFKPFLNIILADFLLSNVFFSLSLLVC